MHTQENFVDCDAILDEVDQPPTYPVTIINFLLDFWKNQWNYQFSNAIR